MKTIILILSLFAACAYSATTSYKGAYLVIDDYDESKCCPPTFFTLSNAASPYEIVAVFTDGAQCNTDGTTEKILTGTAASGSGSTLDVTIGGADMADISFDSTGVATWTGSATCSVKYLKSGYLVGLGALVMLSFVYLFI